MKQVVKRLLCSLLVFSMVLAPSGFINAQTTGLDVATHTKKEIKDYLSNNVDLRKAVAYAETPSISAPYAAGKLTQDTLDSALKTLNAMRYIAGISDNVELLEEYNKNQQASALLNAINGGLSHFPNKPDGMDDGLYDLGYYGASHANIACGYSNLNQAVLGWMSDEDSYNIESVGHRRWVLDPSMKYTGFGAVNRYYSMYSMDGFSRSGATVSKVAWPAQLMPTGYFEGDYPWSLSLGKYIDASTVNVKLTNKNTNQVWSFNSTNKDGYFSVNNQGYGKPGCIIFRPDGISSYNHGDIFNVTITGSYSGSAGSFGTISYDVEFFDINSVQEEKVQITFDADNGQPAVIKEVVKNQALDYAPEAPTKDGYTFVGWFEDVDDVTTKYQSGTAYTKNVTYKAKYAHVQMLGAQAKYIVDGKSGIRFGTKIYTDGDTILEKGTLIIPVDVLGNNALTLENQEAAKSVATYMYEINEAKGYEVYLGTIVGMDATQFDRAMTAAAYVIYQDKSGNKYTVYSPYANGSITINRLLNK